MMIIDVLWVLGRVRISGNLMFDLKRVCSRLINRKLRKMLNAGAYTLVRSYWRRPPFFSFATGCGPNRYAGYVSIAFRRPERKLVRASTLR